MSGAAIASAYGPSAILRLDDGAYQQVAYDPGDAELILTLGSDGILSITGAGVSYAWLTGDVASGYEARATNVTGTPSTGTTGTWNALSDGESWSVARTVSGEKEWIFDLEIGLLGTSTALETARITLTAIVEL